MSTTKSRRRNRQGRFAPAAPPALPRPVPRPAETALFDQLAAETVPAPAETVPPPLPPARPAPTVVDRAEESARLADIEGDAEFRRRKRELALEALDDKARLAAAQRDRDAERAAAETEAEVAEIRDKAAARRWQERGKRLRKRAVTSSLRVRRVAVNLGITGAAVYGQWQYLNDKTKIGSEGALAVSVLVELLAVSVLDYAHRRRQAGRASWHLYLIAASMAASVGMMNYAHWSTKDLALVGALFALFSIAGPLMWSLSVLEAEVSGDGEQPAARRSARFPAEHWVLFLPSTFGAKRLAVRHGILDPGAALDLLAERKAERAAERAARPRRRGKRGKAAEQPAATAPAPLDETVVDPVVDPVVEPVVEPVASPAAPYELEHVPAPDVIADMSPREVQAAARRTARAAIAAGHRPTGLMLGTAYGLSDRWGRDRLQEVDKVTWAAGRRGAAGCATAAP